MSNHRCVRLDDGMKRRTVCRPASQHVQGHQTRAEKACSSFSKSIIARFNAAIGFQRGVAQWLWHEFEPSTTLKICSAGEQCTLNLSRTQTSSRWCGGVVRRRGCRLRTATNVQKINDYDKEGLMITEAITLDCRSYTNVFERDTGTAARYRNEIVEPYVCLFRRAAGPNLILMGDNARPHYFWKERILAG
ncbi:hypothetical protein TNCV_4182481 [Trichonephila clavipes]|nr:hypothetical protein TNCV_4182481 [Trichonephila clavipes]